MAGTSNGNGHEDDVNAGFALEDLDSELVSFLNNLTADDWRPAYEQVLAYVESRNPSP